MKENFKYGLDDKPPFWKLLIFGLQWLAVAIPMIIIVGKVVAVLHFEDHSRQIVYIQKVFFLIGISILIQVIWGYKLPLVIGPSAVLLVGIAAAQGSSIAEIYSAIMIGGLFLAAVSLSGLLKYIHILFTPRVIVSILILIAFTLTPMILELIVPSGTETEPLASLLFALAFVFGMFAANKSLRGLWKSTLIISGILAGSFIYYILFPHAYPATSYNTPILSGFLSDFVTQPAFDAGVIISFLICFLALAINDLGSIRSIGEILDAGQMPERTAKGMAWTGLLNTLSGFLGVIGPVNYSLSPGVIASTGVASRFALIPAGIGLIVLAFIPPAITLIGSIPSAVIGSALIYILCSQIAAGLQLAFSSIKKFKFENGLVLGLPLMLSIIISFLPEDALATFPLSLRPILGNGFAIGVIAVIIMEHIIYREKQQQ